MYSTVNEERKKNITFYTRIADIHERYHRSPTSYELRALEELPLEVSLAKNLWDSTPTGRKIHQLLLDSKNGKEVSYLEEAGRLLWFQEGRNPFNSSTIPDFITPLEKFEKQSMLPGHTYQSSAITNDPFAKAVKRTAVKSTRMENQAPTSDSSTRDASTPEELHLVGYPDALVNQQEQHFVRSPSPPPQSAVNQARQITSGTRTSTLLTQSSTLNSDGNSFHNYSHSVTNYQSQATYPNNQQYYASAVGDISAPYSHQPLEVRRTGSEHRKNEQDYGPELESSDQTPVYQVSQYNISDYDMVEERYDALKPSPSIVMRPQPTPQYKSSYKNLIKIPKSSEDHPRMAEDSINRQESTEIFNEQWNNAFSDNQQPQQHAVQNMYPDPGRFLYFGDGFYPKDVGGPLTHDANAYLPEVVTYGTGRSKYGPPKYKSSASHRSVMPNFNACSGQTVSHDTALSEHPSLDSRNQLSQTSQYEKIRQEAQKSTNLPPSPATSDPFQKTATNSVSGLYSMTDEVSVDDDPGQSIQSFDQTQIQGSYPSYPFDNKRLDASHLAPKQQAPKKNAQTTKTPRKRTPKAKDDHPTARRLLTHEDYHKTIPPSQEILIEPVAVHTSLTPSLPSMPPTATGSKNNPPSLKDPLTPKTTEKETRHRKSSPTNTLPIPTSTNSLPTMKKSHAPYPILGVAKDLDKNLDKNENTGASAVAVQAPATLTQLAAHNLPSDKQVIKSTESTNPMNAEEEPTEEYHDAASIEANSPTPASLSVNSSKPPQSIQEDGTSPLKSARTPRKKRKVNEIEDKDKGERMAKHEVKKRARGRPKKNAV